MALDESQENDEVITERGITFLIEKNLFEEAKPISIEFVESAMGSGFMVKSSLAKSGGCGSSGSSCSC